MRRSKLLAAPLAASAAILLTAAPAQASHPGQYVHNSQTLSTGGCQYVLIYASDHSSRFTNFPCPGQDSQRYATHFGVEWQSRTLYQSISTGAQYWSGCGEDLPQSYGGIDYAGGGPGDGGWQVFGNSAGVSIKLVKTVYHPTAPANVCDGVPPGV